MALFDVRSVARKILGEVQKILKVGDRISEIYAICLFKFGKKAVHELTVCNTFGYREASGADAARWKRAERGAA
ncbi:hypothetical protein [Deinococcus ruber]|uniref:Uncharacterized protein n=1 Tax=Deinococcus ruber TaxID=1848197 RepID=A0A918C5U4_9DEIO|nr:hypothetical protein [Deinococcus ruber]GGR08419.1 hypothetical protein GCM10008957_21450 [Deinococcus ruber]